MRNVIKAAAVIATLFPAVAAGQVFPQNVCANCLVGRMGIGPGPAEAIPFARLRVIPTNSPILISGSLGLSGTMSGTVTLSVQNNAGTWTLKLPTVPGTNGYVLGTDGTGQTSWVPGPTGVGGGTGIGLSGSNPVVVSLLPNHTVTIGSTVLSGGTSTGLLYNNGGVIGNTSFAKITTNGASTPTLFVGTGGDTDDTAVLVSRVLAPASGLLNTHGFRDSTSATQAVTASGFSGYGAFDAAGQVLGNATTAMNHIRNFQARMQYNSSGHVNEMTGLWVGHVVNNGGAIVDQMYGVHVINNQITAGVVSNQYAFYADTLSGAGTNYFLFGGSNPSVLNGNLYVGGRINQLSTEVANIQFNGSTQQGWLFADTLASAGSTSAAVFYRNNSLVGSITTTLTTTAYNTSSDERLKIFTGEYDPKEAIRIIRADPVRTFDWKANGDHDLGWGAQSSYAISNDLATPGTGEPGDKNFRPWGIDKGKRTPYLWAAMADVLDRLDAIERRLP